MIEVKDKHRNSILALSVITTILICLTSFVGLFMPDFYEAESREWQIQCRTQDFINLVIVIPSFLTISLLSFDKRPYAPLLWAGCLLYMVYTYLIYCFDIHFNTFFILYCIILSISVYLLFHFFYSYRSRHALNAVKSPVVKVTAIYFLILPVLFYVFWLSEIIPATLNFTLPASVGESGLFTNPVHVLDLSFLLPGIFITGIMLLQKKRLAFTLAPIFLTFFIFMYMTIMFLTLVMVLRGILADYSLVFMMIAFALFSLLLLRANLRASKAL
jgi:hypothetical protein